TRVPELEVDLSLGRGLRYYTGLVFEVYYAGAAGPLQLCGGGRYDDLVRSLGGRAGVPACGFAFGLERLDMALAEGQTPPAPRPPVEGHGGGDARLPALLRPGGGPPQPTPVPRPHQGAGWRGRHVPARPGHLLQGGRGQRRPRDHRVRRRPRTPPRGRQR